MPLTMPGIFAGGAIVFIWSFTELGVPLVFDYSRVAPVQIYDGLKDLESNPFPYALVAVLLVISSAVFLLSKALLGRSRLGTAPRPKGKQGEKIFLQTPRNLSKRPQYNRNPKQLPKRVQFLPKRTF